MFSTIHSFIFAVTMCDDDESLLFWRDPECFVFLDEFSFVIFFMSQHTSYTQKGKEYEGYQLSTSMNSHHCVGQRPPTSQQPIAIKS